MIKVCFVEDSHVFYNGLKNILQESQEIDLIGTFSNAESFMQEVNFLNPDVVVIDLDLPGMNGINTIINVKSTNPEIKFLVLTVHHDDEYLFNSLKAGASGYILKKESLENVVHEIKIVYEGGSPISPIIANKILNYFKQDNSFEDFNKLTKREKEVLKFIAEGLLNKEIADKLSISIDSIKKYAQNIYEKIQVRNRSEAIKKYMTHAI